MIDDLRSVSCPTIVVTLIQGTDTTPWIIYVSIAVPRDPGHLLTIGVDVSHLDAFTHYPPMNFKCENHRASYVSTDAAPISMHIIRGRKWWPAVIFAQDIASTRKRALYTMFKSIKQWDIVSALPYSTFRLYMWYVFYTIQSSIIMDMRTYLKARAIENKLRYITPADCVIGLTASPFFIERKITFSNHTPAIKPIVSMPQFTYVSPSSTELGVRQVDI
jgi:hypothetical protein